MSDIIARSLKQSQPLTKKSLGQHWLDDPTALEAMVAAADIQPSDTILEIGPGPGALTVQLVKQAKEVIAVEFDADLAHDLPRRVPADNLEVIQQDILKFDLSRLPAGYKVVANIPYYLTSNLLRVLCESTNPFDQAALLIQKEVAERVCANPGHMSLLSVSVQFYCHVQLGRIVPAALFTPPPKVDSQILILQYRNQPLFGDFRPEDVKQFFQIVKAGFAQRRKTLLNSLRGGLHLSRPATLELLEQAGVDPLTRAQNLDLQQWHGLYSAWQALS